MGTCTFLSPRLATPVCQPPALPVVRLLDAWVHVGCPRGLDGMFGGRCSPAVRSKPECCGRAETKRQWPFSSRPACRGHPARCQWGLCYLWHVLHPLQGGLGAVLRVTRLVDPCKHAFDYFRTSLLPVHVSPQELEARVPSGAMRTRWASVAPCPGPFEGSISAALPSA